MPSKSSMVNGSISMYILLMEEILHHLHQLRLVVYPITYKVLYVPGGAGFLPSTVVANEGLGWDPLRKNENIQVLNRGKGEQPNVYILGLAISLPRVLPEHCLTVYHGPLLK